MSYDPTEREVLKLKKKALALTVAMWMCYIGGLLLVMSWSWQVGVALIFFTIGNNIERSL